MHDWSDDSIDWQGIGEAARFIALNLKRWGRVNVMDWKEKWGTVRVYCSFGFYGLHEITHPGHAYIRYKKGGILWHINYSKMMRWLTRYILNPIVVPYQTWLYTYLYGRALQKWPHLRLEILSGADYSELLKKYGVHIVKTSENGATIYHDWHPNNYVRPKEEEDPSEKEENEVNE